MKQFLALVSLLACVCPALSSAAEYHCTTHSKNLKLFTDESGATQIRSQGKSFEFGYSGSSLSWDAYESRDKALIYLSKGMISGDARKGYLEVPAHSFDNAYELQTYHCKRVTQTVNYQ